MLPAAAQITLLHSKQSTQRLVGGRGSAGRGVNSPQVNMHVQRELSPFGGGGFL